ncbi:MAG: putative ABC transporter permease subunit, partial [Chloroflexota bacterium]
MLLVLLRHRLRLWRNQTFRGPRRLGRILALVFTLAAGLAFLGLVYRGSLGLFALLAQVDPALARPSLSILFAGVVSMGLFTGIGAVLYQLYLASDLDLLLAAPVSLRALFLLKLVEASFATCVEAIMGLAALLGYAQAVGMPPSFLPLSLLIVGATILLTAALAMGIVMLAMRIVPARW